jgi:CBS-domain-containing membrane protein
MPSAQSSLRVADVMTRSVRSADPRCEVGQLWQMLADEHCHHVPIVDRAQVVGMVSSSDHVSLAGEHGAVLVSSGRYARKTAGDVMSESVVSVQVDDSVETAVERIGRGDIHALVVLDEDDKLAGIVTHRDLLHYLLS